jgi:quinol monooxygenase YgiN
MAALRLLGSSTVLGMVTSASVISGLRVVAPPGDRAQVIARLNAWAEGVRQSPGCLKVTCAEQVEDPNVLYAVSEWESDQALEDFRNSPRSRDLSRPLVKLLAEPAKVTRLRADEVEAKAAEIEL